MTNIDRLAIGLVTTWAIFMGVTIYITARETSKQLDHITRIIDVARISRFVADSAMIANANWVSGRI